MAYDPDRVRALGRRTLDAIAALGAIRSADPAAADAVRAARLTRRNLEELWVPAIRGIERSEAMTRWTGVDADADGALSRPLRQRNLDATASQAAPRPLGALGDDELFDLVDLVDRLLTDEPLEGARIDTYGADTLPAKYDLDVLADELARRVRAGVGFRRRLLAHAPRTVVVGQLVGRARFPIRFVADLAVALTGAVGTRAARDPSEFGRAIAGTLDVLTDHPAIALDVLLDDRTLRHLSSSHHVDTEAVAAFTTSALTFASTHRLADGYRVIERATGMDTGHLNAGFSLGLALSMDGFLDTLAPAIARRDDQVVIAAVAGLPTVGSYADLRNLFGEMLRHADAAAALGASLGRYGDRSLDRLGDDLGREGTLATLAQVAAMVDEATTSEQAQLMMEAGATEAARRRAGEVVGAGATVLLTASGVGATARGLVGAFVGLGTDALARVEPEQLAGASIGGHLYHRISVSVLRAALTRPEVSAAFSGREHTDDELAEFARRLDEIDDCDQGAPCPAVGASRGAVASRADALSVLEQDLGDDSRAIRFLDHVRASSGLERLR